MKKEECDNMKNKLRIWKTTAIGVVILLFPNILSAGTETDTSPSDSTVFYSPIQKTSSFSERFIHRVGMEIRPGYVFRTHPFLQGDNEERKLIQNYFSPHFKYSFQPQKNSYADRVYGAPYQGVGVSFYTFGERKYLGNPLAFYIFQGARIAQFTERLSANYEWNFGVSGGWKPYDRDYNYYNRMMGTKLNAYMDINFYMRWTLSPQVDLTYGLNVTHFSNGNTKFPNAGLNTAGFTAGIVYNFNRKENSSIKALYQPVIPKFPRHISYDLVLFGSWRRKGVYFGEDQVASPDAYTVMGFNFAPMYNLGYKLRVGASLDGVYDASANVYTEDYIIGTNQEFFKPPVKNQLALGVSARGEYVMPYFTVGLGLGTNILHGGGDLKAFYQILALKIEMTRNSFLHIGYSLQNFHEPNFLMLGIGFRFHNRYPTFCR